MSVPRNTAPAIPLDQRSATNVIHPLFFQLQDGFDHFFLAGPTIAAISPSVVLVAGGSDVTVTGTGFGTKDYTLSASIGETACDSVTFTSDSSITAKVAKGVGKAIFQIAVSGQYATVSAAYQIPVLILANPGNVPGSSAVLVEIRGGFFGTFNACGRAVIGTTLCEMSKWQASTSIFCKVSRGFGTLMTAAVTIGHQMGTVTAAATYDRPILSSASKFNAPCFLPGSFLLFGKGFGFSADAAVSIGASLSSQSTISSDSSVLSNISPGIGTGLSVSITIGGLTGSLSNVFSYDGTFFFIDACFFLNFTP